MFKINVLFTSLLMYYSLPSNPQKVMQKYGNIPYKNQKERKIF